MAPQMLSQCPVQHKRLRERWQLGKWVYKGPPAPALEGSSLGQTQCFAEGNKANFLTSKWQTQTRVSYVRDCHFRHAVTLPNVFSIAVNRQKGMILGSLGVLVLLHFGFRF